MSLRFIRNPRVLFRTLNFPHVRGCFSRELAYSFRVKYDDKCRLDKRLTIYLTFANNVSAHSISLRARQLFCLIFCSTRIVHASSRIYLYFLREFDSPVFTYTIYIYAHMYVYNVYTCTNIRCTYSTILSLGGAQKWRVFTIRWKHGAQGSEK